MAWAGLLLKGLLRAGHRVTVHALVVDGGQTIA